MLFDRRRTGERRAVVALSVAVGVLAFLLWRQVGSTIDVSPLAPGAAPQVDARARSAELATALDKKPAAGFRETVERPLFHPTRRPVERAAPAPAETQGDPGGMRLVGVSAVGGQKRALIRITGDAQGRWIAEGEALDGWKLKSVKDRSVIIESAGRSHELTLSMPRRAPEEQGNAEPDNAAQR